MKKGFYDVNNAGKFFLWAVVAPQLVATVVYLIMCLISSLTGLFYEEVYGLFADIYVISMVTQFAFALVLIFCNRRINVVKACKINKMGWRNWLICVAIGAIGLFALNPISNCFVWLFETIGLSFSSAMPFEPSGIFTLITAIILFALIPSILEEFVFRGAILQGLKKYGNWKSILISAALFALIHGNLLQIPYTFLFGILLGFVVIKTGSILSSIIIHFIANSLTIIFYNFNVFSGEITINFLYWVIAFVVLFAFAVIVYYLTKLLKNEDKSLNTEELLNEINKINLPENDINSEKKLSKEEKFAQLAQEICAAEKYANKGTISKTSSDTVEEKIKQVTSPIFKPDNNTYFLKFGIIIGIVVLVLQTLLLSV